MQNHLRQLNLALVATAVFVQGCATASKDVASVYISPLQYQSYDCDQLALETARIQSRVIEVGGRLDQAATNDKVITGVGLILFWPALFALGGTKAQEAEFGRLKGEYEALEQAVVSRKCRSNAPTSRANRVQSGQDEGRTESRLKALSELHTKGLISDEELRARRLKVLDEALSPPK